MNNFINIVQEVYSNRAIRKASSDFIFLFYILQGMLMFTMSGSLNVAVSYSLENSMNDGIVFWNFFFFIISFNGVIFKERFIRLNEF